MGTKKWVEKFGEYTNGLEKHLVRFEENQEDKTEYRNVMLWDFDKDGNLYAVNHENIVWVGWFEYLISNGIKIVEDNTEEFEKEPKTLEDTKVPDYRITLRFFNREELTYTILENEASRFMEIIEKRIENLISIMDIYGTVYGFRQNDLKEFFIHRITGE
ncbi:MAG: hypothetical protein ACRC0V_05200 [Fusobacteriaceae bacterium]